MFIYVTFRILSFRTLPFIPHITPSQLSAFRIPRSAKYPFPYASAFEVSCSLLVLGATHCQLGESLATMDIGRNGGLCMPLLGPLLGRGWVTI